MQRPHGPNVIFILMDDLGWRDVGCYGSEFYETPNLDRLAAEGMRFTDAYAACPVCSPSRASILTGRYPARVGVTNYIDWGGRSHPSRGKLIDAPYLRQLPRDEYNLARALSQRPPAGSAGSRQAGWAGSPQAGPATDAYQTWHVGKWHLGGEGFHPHEQGFDVNVAGCECGHPPSGYFSPWKIKHLDDGPAGEYLPDRLTDEAIRLIRGRDDGRPFFLNLWYYLVHTPIQAKDDDVAYFADKARRMGLDKVEAIEEGEPFPCEHKKDKRVRRRRVQSHPAYAAMVRSMDENIGRLLDALQEADEAENTAVFYTSDNGGLATAEGSPTCNAPLAEGKGWMYEGGTREPLIVRWPGRVKAGTVCDVPVTSPDFYPTVLEIAGRDPIPEQHCDGVSLLPLLEGAGGLGREAIFWHYPHYGNQGGTPGASVRCGDEKLIEFFEDDRVELYDLREDIGEDRDLAADRPKRAAALRDRLHEWQEEVAAIRPQPNRDFVPWR